MGGCKRVALPTVNLLFCSLKASKTFFQKTVPRLTVDYKCLDIAKKLERKISKTLGDDTFCAFYFRSGIIVSYFEMLCNYPKIPQRKSYEIQGVNRFLQILFYKNKNGWDPPLKFIVKF